MITTMLHSGELNVPLPNAELQELLDRVRAESNMNWQVQRREFVTRDWLYRKKTIVRYAVFLEVGGVLPYEQVNFWSEEGSMKLLITESELASYLMGLKNGMEIGETTIAKVWIEDTRKKDPKGLGD